MRLTLRLNLSLIFGVAAVSLAFAFYQRRMDTRERMETRGLRSDLNRQSQLLAESLANSAEPLLAARADHPARADRQLQSLIDKFEGRERVAGIVRYDGIGATIAATGALAPRNSIHQALEMPLEERGARMQRMRPVIRERNIYRRAGTLIGELCEIRLQKPPKPVMEETAAVV